MNTVEYRTFPLIISQRDTNTMRKKWDSHHYQCHVARVQTAKSEIDNVLPWRFLNHHIQMKRIKLEQERLAVIEKNNRLLLERIGQIMRSKGSVDHWNDFYLRRIY